jgi:hypothetical protein
MNNMQQAGIALFAASFLNGLWTLYRTSEIATPAIKQRFKDNQFRWTLMISPTIGMVIGLALYKYSLLHG